MGGQVDILSMGNTLGWACKTLGLMLVRLAVHFKAVSTCLVVLILVFRKALGANFKNQPLKKSTDFAISLFHISGLSLFTPKSIPPSRIQGQISRRCMRSAAFALLGNDASISICYIIPPHKLFPRKV